MKNLVIGTFIALGLAACSDSDGGGTGGAGGIQDPESTSSTTASGTGGDGSGGDTTSTASSSPTSSSSGGACGRGPDTQAVCDAVAVCEPGDNADCFEEIDEERCADPACTDEHDAWIGCVASLAEAGDWNDCPDYPDACDAQREAYDICTCGTSFVIEEICDYVEACEPGGGESCIEEAVGERCVGIPGCIDLYDQWLFCVDDLAISDAWDECPDYPSSCDDLRNAYEAQCVD